MGLVAIHIPIIRYALDRKPAVESTRHVFLISFVGTKDRTAHRTFEDREL